MLFYANAPLLVIIISICSAPRDVSGIHKMRGPLPVSFSSLPLLSPPLPSSHFTLFLPFEVGSPSSCGFCEALKAPRTGLGGARPQNDIWCTYFALTNASTIHVVKAILSTYSRTTTYKFDKLKRKFSAYE